MTHAYVLVLGPETSRSRHLVHGFHESTRLDARRHRKQRHDDVPVILVVHVRVEQVRLRHEVGDARERIHVAVDAVGVIFLDDAPYVSVFVCRVPDANIFPLTS